MNFNTAYTLVLSDWEKKMTAVLMCVDNKPTQVKPTKTTKLSHRWEEVNLKFKAGFLPVWWYLSSLGSMV